jgi:large subunit ribosomal protein L30
MEITKPVPDLKKVAEKHAAKNVRVKAAEKPVMKPKTGQKIAAVLIRGREIGIRHDVKQALDILKLRRRHICVVYEDSPSLRGLLVKCKDLITYGPISDDMYKQLHDKRGSLKNRDGKQLDVFRMHPPRGGYRKGIKVSYQEGGDLGYRRKGMDDFLAKML